MRVGIITYNVKHLKTQQVLYGLLSKNCYSITLIIKKFKKYKNLYKPLFKHRPNQFIGDDVFEIANYYNLKIKTFGEKDFYKNLDIILICGSGIIEKKFIKKNYIINCHSGLIPQSRGLDSFKWDIFNNRIIGNTLHYIDENIDMGKIISQNKTPLFKNDNLNNFALRHYHSEINMLINFEQYLKKNKKFKLKKYKPSMRMPKKIEKKLIKKFENYKKKYAL